MKTALFISLILTLNSPAEAPRPVVDKNSHRLVEVPAGEYPVGHREADTNPLRKVKLACYFIATAETTNAQFGAFIEATNYRTDAERLGHGKVFTVGMADWQ